MLWVLIALLCLCLVLFLAGYFLLDFTCGRRKPVDAWNEQVIHERGWDHIKGEILAGKRWLEGQKREELEITGFDGLKLRALFVPHPEARGTLLLFHGWRSSWKTDFTVALPFYHSLGLNLLLADQRSQNSSEGKYMTYGIREQKDVVSWADLMAEKLGKDHPLFLGGLSMGAATVLMASDLEYKGNVRGVLADCGFTSPWAIIRKVASRTKAIPLDASSALLNVFTRRFAGFDMKEKSTVDALARTKLPVLLIHGLADDFVPSEMSRENYAACNSEKELVLVEGAGHGMSYVVEPERVKAAIGGFIQKHLA
ncbi:MAG: alpha/beta hydrolase [Oscillospiraceae bacterium]|nr:alpha/beta hydrolase [Oscillospiraceae bacterium]